jgi:hypothetical protein
VGVEGDLRGRYAEHLDLLADTERGQHVATVGGEAEKRARFIAPALAALVDHRLDPGPAQEHRHHWAGDAAADDQTTLRGVRACHRG